MPSRLFSRPNSSLAEKVSLVLVCVADVKCHLWVKPYVNAASVVNRRAVTLCFIVGREALAIRAGSGEIMDLSY